MQYSEILKSVGYPEQVLVLDFESYFDKDYSLSKMSTIEYICSPNFDFTGVGARWEGNKDPVFYSDPGKQGGFWGKPYLADNDEEPNIIEHFKLCFGKNLERCTVVAKNCKFDIKILAEKFNIIPPYVIDINDLLRYYDSRMSHRMKDVAPMYGLQPKGDTKQFSGLHYEDMSDGQRDNLAEYGRNDVDIEVKLFKKLLPQLSNPVVEIPLARHTLQLYLEPKFKFDFKLAEELKADMQVELTKIVEATNNTKEQLSGNLSFVELLKNSLPDGEKIPIKAGKPGKNMTKLLGISGVIPAFAKDDTGFQELLIHSDKKVRNLCKARKAVRSWPLHLKRIDNMSAQARCCDGLLPVDLKYYGGHTGRWSGSGGINLQNLGGRGRTGSGINSLISKMRNMLGTPDGFILGISDSAQIEARILAWIASQDDLVEGFANGEDIYSVFATKLFQSYIYKALDDDPPPVKKMLKIRRGFGKDAILGCGYGMGADKFYQRCLANEDLRPLFDSGEYNHIFIERLIKTYRKTYSRIPEFWKSVEKAFKWVIKYPHETISVYIPDDNLSLHGYKKEIPAIIRNALLTFWNENGTVHLQLPSGRELIYRHCTLKKTTMGTEIKWHWGHLWGGSITENIVQAIARDLLGVWILEMKKAGLDVIFTSHDEIVCMLEEHRSGIELCMMYDIMRSAPDWATGLPLDAEGFLSKEYTK